MSALSQTHELIQSFSEGEKKYLRTRMRQGSGEEIPDYFRLYLDLERPDFKPEESGKVSARNLNYLREQIFDLMRTHHRNISLDQRLANYLTDIDLLFRKRQFALVRTRVRTAKKLALRTDRFQVLIELARYEGKLLRIALPKDFEARWEQGQEAQRIYARQQQNLLDFRLLLERAYLIQMQGGTSASDRLLEEFRGLELLSDSGQALSQQALIYFYQLKGLLARAQSNSQGLRDHFASILEIYREDKWRREEEPEAYRKVLSNYLTACYLLGRYQEIEAELGNWFALPAPETSVKAEIFELGTFMKVLVALGKGEFDRAEALEEEVRAGVRKYRNSISHERWLGFCCNLAILLFFDGRYSRANRYLHDILNEPESHTRQDIRRFARIWQQVIYIETEEWELLESLTRSASRYFQQQGDSFGMEVQKYFRALMSGNIYSFRAGLRGLLAVLESPLGSQSQVGKEELKAWVRGRLSD